VQPGDVLSNGLLGNGRSLPSASTSYQWPPLRRRLTKVSPLSQGVSYRRVGIRPVANESDQPTPADPELIDRLGDEVGPCSPFETALCFLIGADIAQALWQLRIEAPYPYERALRGFLLGTLVTNLELIAERPGSNRAVSA